LNMVFEPVTFWSDNEEKKKISFVLPPRQRAMFSVLKQLREKSGTANVLAPYTPTPDAIVSAALEFAGVGEGDVVYDVGCGDARLLTAAIERGAVKAVGWDIDTKAIEDAQERIDGLKLGDRVSVSCEDVFTAPIDWAAASVIVLYLSVQGNLRLRPILLGMEEARA